MRHVLLSCTLLLTACSKHESLLGALPANAGDLFGTLCADAGDGVLEPDDKLVRAKETFIYNTLTPDLEAIRCGPQHYGTLARNSLVYDRKTRRLFGLQIFATYKDVPILEQLLLPALSDSERVGYQLEKMRLYAPWVQKSIHSWSDGHTVLWTSRNFHLDQDTRTIPSPADTFQLGVFIKEK
jgi:hypothetical protein